MEEHHLSVPRTARYHSLGETATARAIWIVLHGYGHLARYFLRHFEGLGDGLLIAAPEGLSRFYLDAEHTRVGATWMTWEDREQEIADQRGYLDLLAAHLQRTSPPGVPLYVLGFSQGVATAMRWAISGVIKSRRLVLWGGSLPPEIGAASLSTQLATCQVDIVHGLADTIVPAAAAAQTAAKFRGAGVPHTTHTHPGGHEFDRLLLERLLRIDGSAL